MLQESGIMNDSEIKNLNKEAEEILAILSTSKKTMREKYYSQKK